MPRFDGKVAIITGSSSGIGRATAILFVKEGAKVTITGRDADALKVTKSECLKAGAKEENIVEVLGDITKEEVRSDLIKKTIDKFGKLDILINNHGGARHEKDKDGNWDINAFDGTIDQNCKSTLALSLMAMPHLKATKGQIVNVSSIAASSPTAPHMFYAVSKAALEHLTRLLAFKNAKDGIRVNCVAPGLIATAFLAKLGIDDEAAEKIRNCYLDAIPLARVGEPNDIAEPIAFLADGHASGYMTGQTIIVDGGTTLQHSMGTVDAPRMIAEKEGAAKK